jgi:ABC-2 type transport system permease protein
MTVILQVIFILLVCLIFYFDKISDVLNLEFNQAIPINIESSLRKFIVNEDEWTTQGFVFTNDKEAITITKEKDLYLISKVDEINIQSKIYQLLLSNHQLRMESESNSSVYKWLEKYESIEVEFLEFKVEDNQFKHQLIILFLTSIYFMMLNFIAVNSNEIIMEKTSHMIPIILSSVSVRVHFITKLIVGFSSIVFQIVSSIGIVGLVILSRYRLDQGKGLIQLIVRYLPVNIESISLSELLKLIDFKWSDVNYVLLGLLFILLGIFLIQICILILSSKVRTMEEAASIQGPFYLFLLVTYYLALSLNTSHSLSTGLGYSLSFVPVFSMLIMPMRLLTENVISIEVMVSILFTIVFISLIFILFYPIYEKSIKN